MHRKIYFIGVAICVGGCSSLIKQSDYNIIDDRHIDDIIAGCPTLDALSMRARVVEIKANLSGNEALTAYLEACPKLTQEQQLGYWHLLHAAERERVHALASVKTAERRRRAGSMRRAGDTIMAISRTRDTNEIQREID